MKSVIVFVEQYNIDDGSTKYFTESTEFGADSKYASAAQFVIEFQKMYTKFNNDSNSTRFSIYQVVIG